MGENKKYLAGLKVRSACMFRQQEILITLLLRTGGLMVCNSRIGTSGIFTRVYEVDKCQEFPESIIMNKKYSRMLVVSISLPLVLAASAIILFYAGAPGKDPWTNVKRFRPHFNHSPVLNEKFATPGDVTKACLSCHEEAASDFMKTAHWRWERSGVSIPGKEGVFSIGKKNLPNNFCIGVQGNEKSCNVCHAGYGWKDATYNFNKKENVDCLVCHDWSGTYTKGAYGMPSDGVDLLAVAKSVGYPKRQNCGLCHNYGGGGMGVKHGDLDESLLNAYADLDIHMSRDMICIDCHVTEKHNIKGTSYSVSVDHRNGINCTDCHEEQPHKDVRINSHTSSVACQTCHIPRFARRAATKIFWDWSKAGNSARKDDIHTYLKIKGEFVYGKDLIPEYYWFNMTVKRYLWNDILDPLRVTLMNPPQGGIGDRTAKIWPFKVHRAIQPYDKVYKYLLQPVTAGKGGYWSEFNWDRSFRLSENISGIKYSGSYGFTRTDMHWPLSHMVTAGDKALRCNDCHGPDSRMNWNALGYHDDPLDSGGREKMSAGGAK